MSLAAGSWKGCDHISVFHGQFHISVPAGVSMSDQNTDVAVSMLPMFPTVHCSAMLLVDALMFSNWHIFMHWYIFCASLHCKTWHIHTVQMCTAKHVLFLNPLCKVKHVIFEWTVRRAFLEWTVPCILRTNGGPCVLRTSCAVHS